MNLEAPSFARCVKHPSQFFTGFCSFCLAERLSNVDSIERNTNPNPNPQSNLQNEIVEISIDPDRDRSHGEVRVRTTLLSLFQLDDCNGDSEEKSVSVESKTRSGSKRVQIEEGCFNCVTVGKRLERKRSLRHSCDWRACRDDTKDGLERPRHSWDGSMMSKALTCSFAACLEERLDGSSRVQRRVPEEYRQESRREIDVSDVSRKKSHRWSRVWDWSITSPFRDFGKKRQHVLDRSMSESWPESRGSTVNSSVNGKSSIRTRSVNGVGSEIQKYRPDLQKKREYRFGRSRSVHYPSPGNVDNGLLRFYLTPMRTSRSTNKGRTKTSRLFTRGLLGI